MFFLLPEYTLVLIILFWRGLKVEFAKSVYLNIFLHGAQQYIGRIILLTYL